MTGSEEKFVKFGKFTEKDKKVQFTPESVLKAFQFFPFLLLLKFFQDFHIRKMVKVWTVNIYLLIV